MGPRPLHVRLTHEVVTFVLMACGAARAGALSDGNEFFEQRIRPVLVEQCYQCHSTQAQKVKGDLLLDSKAGALKGGKDGPVIVAGEPDKSRLIEAIGWTNKGLKMPPKHRLTDEQVADFVAWVKMGAPDPRTGQATAGAMDLAAARRTWAFSPPADPPVPAVNDESWRKSPIDHFILAKLEARGLKPAPPADKRTLIRRAYFDLIGLPPKPEEVEAFVADQAPDAFAKIVERLLASAHYGERWGRHWLDVVRYTDSFDQRGLGNEGDCAFAWRYRDWVIKALNQDMPYDQFVRNQIAGDLLPAAHPGEFNADGLIATGMYVIGNWPGGDADRRKMMTDLVDDQIDVTGRAFLGVTLACARCHDHKFDPITQQDYYGLAGIFFSTHFLPNPGSPASGVGMIRLPLASPAEVEKHKQYDAHVAELQKQIDQFVDSQYIAQGREAIPRTDRYLSAAWEFLRDAKDGQSAVVENLAADRDLDGYLLGRWVEYLKRLRKDPPSASALGNWIKFASDHTDAGDVEQAAAKVRDVLLTLDERPPAQAGDGNAKLYQELTNPAGPFWDPARKELSHLAPRFKAAIQEMSDGLAEVKMQAPPPLGLAHGLIEGGIPQSEYEGIHDSPILIRGRYDRKGPLVPRGFPKLLAGDEQPPITKGSGRLELSDWIASPRNPMTAKVMANRIWEHHFGQGIVRTPNNFGKLGVPPTHPELLDWLARRFVESGWSIKSMHRLIMLSAAYQQSCEADAEALKADPDNLLLGRMNRRRLEAEPLRDALLSVSGNLQDSMGGPAFRDLNTPRRTVYLMTIRSDRSNYRMLFDAADPTAIIDQRIDSTVAPQALFLLNDPFVLDRALSLAARVLKQGPDDDRGRVEWLYKLLYSRPATQKEIDIALAALDSAKSPQPAAPELVWQQYCQILLCANEFVYVD